MKQTKRDKIIDAVIFILLLAAVSAVMLVLFYRQTTGSPERYHSDMKAYILEMQGLESGYEFPYPVFFKLSALIDLFVGPELAVAIATTLLNGLAMVITKLAFNGLVFGKESGVRILGKAQAGAESSELPTGQVQDGGGNSELPPGQVQDSEGSCNLPTGQVRDDGGNCNLSVGKGWIAGALISVVSISIFFISMLFPPGGIYLPGIKYNYLGVFTANPFHNATYMAARPFMILAFLWFVKLLPVYEGGLCRECGKPGDEFRASLTLKSREKTGAYLGDYILFSLFLLLATMTKPSFTLVLVSTAGLIMLYRMIRSGFQNFLPTIQFGLTFVPTFIDLLYQYKGVFVPGEGAEGGVGFSFGEVWAQYCDNLPLAVCLAVGFPLLVLLLHFKECKKNTLFLFSWQLYVVSFLEAFLLYEKGFRKFDFNFSWGYMCGIFFCHFGALLVLMKATKRVVSDMKPGAQLSGGTKALPGAKDKKGISLKSAALLTVQWLAYLCHLFCGLRYFWGIFGGAMYY